MLIVAIPYEIHRASKYGNANDIGLWFLKVLSSISLTQSWIPTWTVFGSFNGVAWFLSALMFVYFAFPAIMRRIRKMKDTQVIVLMLLIYTVMILVTFSVRNLVIIGTYPDNCYWTSYTCPLLRLGDFTTGICIGRLFQNERNNAKSPLIYTVGEILAFGLVGLSVYFYSEGNTFLGQNWFRYTDLWLPSSLIMVWVFASNMGIISKMLTNRLLVWIGDLSSITFLTHWLIIFYFGYVYNHTLYNPVRTIISRIGASDPDIISDIIRCVLALLITLGVSALWRRISSNNYKFIRNRDKN